MSCTAINSSGSKGYLSKVFGGFRHTGSALTIIGSSIDYQTKTDFTSAVGVSFSAFRNSISKNGFNWSSC